MQKILITTVVALLAFTTATVQAKDKHKSKKHERNSHARSSYVQSSQYRGSSHSYSSNSRSPYGDRDYDRRDYDRRDYSNSHRDRTRTIYIIRNDRPVQQVVYVDDGGRYYRRDGGRRTYIGNHYFESYPSRYYTSSGQRRINIRLPF
jgi:hypothetical protein